MNGMNIVLGLPGSHFLVNNMESTGRWENDDALDLKAPTNYLFKGCKVTPKLPLLFGSSLAVKE